MKGGLGNLMKQAQQMQEQMQRQLEQAQQELSSLEVTGEAGGGMVKVTINGRHEARKVHIEPAVHADDRELLEDLLAAAFNDAAHKLEAASQAKLAAAMGGLQLPPGMKLPF